MRDLESAVIHGEVTADTISRLLESARYASGLAQAALGAGLPLDAEPGAGMVPMDAPPREHWAHVPGVAYGVASRGARQHGTASMRWPSSVAAPRASLKAERVIHHGHRRCATALSLWPGPGVARIRRGQTAPIPAMIAVTTSSRIMPGVPGWFGSATSR